MKKLVIIPAILMSMAANALPNGWVVTVFKQAYNNLTNAITVPLAAGWDDPDVVIPLGFTHNAFGKTTDTMYIDGANLSLGADVTTSLSGTVNFYSPGIDIIDRATIMNNLPSTISFKTEGTSGNRVAKIQWANLGFFGEYDINSTLNDSANFQMWFYEGDGAIEYRYGTSYLDDFERNVESTKLPIGFTTNLNAGLFTFDWLYYLSSLNTPQVDSFNLAGFPTVDYGILDYPQDSTVIRFSPVPVSTKNVVKLNDELTFYPTVVSTQAFLEFAKPLNGVAVFRVLNMNGSVLLQQPINQQKNTIDLQSFAAGHYILQVQYEGQNIFYKFLKN